jgi:hypothetical protein
MAPFRAALQAAGIGWAKCVQGAGPTGATHEMGWQDLTV